MTGFVKIILEASFTAGLAALAVLLIRLAMKNAPKRWAYALWAVVFFRCLCPFSVESGLSAFNAVTELRAETERFEELPEMAEGFGTENILPIQTELNTYGYQTAAPALTDVPPVYAPPPVVTESVPEKKPVDKYAVMFAVWAFGAAAMALYGVVSYVLLMRKLRTAVKTEEGVFESDRVSTAFSAGFFPPKIYLPCGLFDEERKLIVAHERVHIRRLDYIVKPIAFLALAVHWFNPFIWLAFALMTRDMELSCDEAVLKIFGAGEKKAYSEALLRVSMRRSGLADGCNFLPLAFAETGIKGRVKNVLKYKKPTLIVTVFAAAAVVIACVVLGTNAKSPANAEPFEYTEFRKGVRNQITDVNGNTISLYDNRFADLVEPSENSGVYYKRAFVEGNIDLASSTVSFGDGSLNRLIMAVDMTELKINSLEVFSEEGKSFLKAQFEFTLAEGAKLPTSGGLIRLGNDKEPRLLTVEGGGNDDVYVVSAEYELQSSGGDKFAFSFNDFGDVPIYINSELIKDNGDDSGANIFPVAEGEFRCVLDSGEKVCINCDPDREVTFDGIPNITLNADPPEGSKRRAVLIGMQDNNNMLDRQCGVDFTGEDIEWLVVDDISVTEDAFTVKLKVTYPEGVKAGFFANEDEPNAPLRVVRGAAENECYIYLTASYDKDNVKEYAIDICGFDNIAAGLNVNKTAMQYPEGTVIYEQLFKGTTNLSLNGYVPAYIACGLEESGSTGVIGYSDTVDGGQSMLTGFHDDYSFQFRNAYTGKDEYVRVANYGENDYIHILGMTTKLGANTFASTLLDMEKFGVKSITLEDMYTENEGDTLYLNIDLKFTSDAMDVMEISSNQVSDAPGTYSLAVHKLANEGEYVLSVKVRYLYGADSLDSFAVILSGFEGAEKYINPKLMLDRADLSPAEENPYDNEKIEKVYKNKKYAQISLYSGGLFRVTDFLSSFMTGINEKEYRFENGSLILEFEDGSVLCFDETYGTGTQADGEASYAFNEAASHKADARSRRVPFFEDGEVFTFDKEWLEIGKTAERERTYRSTVDYGALEVAYRRDDRTIYLFKNGDFDLYDSSCEFWENLYDSSRENLNDSFWKSLYDNSREDDPNEGIDGSYKIDGETLTLKYKNGSRLCFDMVSSGYEELDPALVKEFELCKYKLVYDSKSSRISKKHEEDIPPIYHGEVFDFDENFIAMKLQSGDVSEEFFNSRERISDEEYYRKYVEPQIQAEEKLRRLEEEERKRAEEAEVRRKMLESCNAAVDFIENPYTEFSKAYFSGVNVLLLQEDGTFMIDCIVRNYAPSERPEKDYTYDEDGALLLNFKDGSLLRFVPKNDNLSFDLNGSHSNTPMDVLLYDDGAVFINYENAEEYMQFLMDAGSMVYLQYPVDARISEHFGGDRVHKGIDFEVKKGTEVYAAASGEVTEVGTGWNGGYGTSVTVKCVKYDMFDMENIYAHMDEVLVKEGDKVNAGDLIGYSGSTGDTVYETLHFEVRIDGEPVDPEEYLQ